MAPLLHFRAPGRQAARSSTAAPPQVTCTSHCYSCFRHTSSVSYAAQLLTHHHHHHHHPRTRAHANPSIQHQYIDTHTHRRLSRLPLTSSALLLLPFVSHPALSHSPLSHHDMASASFRDSINSLGWSRRDADLPVSTANSSTSLLDSIQTLNPFASSRAAGQVRLPTHEGPGAPLPAPTRREEDEGWFARKFRSAHHHHHSHLRRRQNGLPVLLYYPYTSLERIVVLSLAPLRNRCFG